MILKSPDFIIPFLISHSAEAIARMQTNTKKKRYSVPSKNKEPNNNSSMELTKIYKSCRKKSVPEKQEKEKSLSRQEKTALMEREEKQGQELLREKGSSQLQLNLHKSPYIARNRFLKAHSLINHLPYNHFEDATDAKPSPPKHSPSKKDIDSPIPGVRFKRTPMFNESANLFTPQAADEDYRSEFAGKIKHWREKKDWNRKRSANVDFIINRKCKNFNDLVGEYRKRLTLPETARIFIFNSKDLWMKRALTERGWIENRNKDSRAFHLYWSNKVMKESVFPEQMLNHYPSSDLLTSKAGLHRMLLKYGLAQLQPMTFDLALQRSEFILYYTKLAFLTGLRKLIKKFDFQEEPANVDIEVLRGQAAAMKHSRPEMRGAIEGDLMGVVEACFILIDGRLHELTTCYLDNALFKIHSMLELNQNQEELVRILRDFHMSCARHRLFTAETAFGDQNIWLSKSKNSSKGVGISLHKDLDEILKHSNRLAQKYIQNPLIFSAPSIKGRKFDIRIWVLLVGNLNARLYYHQKFYGRLCFEAYSLDTINLDNQKKHLTNYSQNKNSFRDDALANSILLPETIFQLVTAEKGLEYRGLFFERVEGLLSKMGSIFRNEIAVGNPNSFQLFGLDLLIDDNLNLHLLEVNLSAACEERHEALSSMMEDVAHGLLNILEGRNSPNDLRGWKIVK